MNTEHPFVSPTGTIRCALYARTASTPPGEIDAAAVLQIDQCKEVAQKNGWTVAEECVRIDGSQSGISMQGRSGLVDLIHLAAVRPRPFDYLICASTDRLGRNLSIVSPIINALIHNGVGLYFASDGLDSAGSRFRELFLSLAETREASSKIHGEKVRRGLMRCKAERARRAAALSLSITA